MTARDSNESSSGSKGIIYFEPDHWYFREDIIAPLRIGADAFKEMKSQGLTPFPLGPEKYLGQQINQVMKKMIGWED